MIGVRVEGLARLERNLRQLSPETKKELRREFRKIGERVADTAKQLVPVRTGRLRKSIGVRNTRRGVGVKAGTESRVKYAPVIEFGGRHPLWGRDKWVSQPAQPFLRPAVDRHERDITDAAEDAIRQAIRDVGL